MPNWNPHSPDVVGIEWAPTISRRVPFGGRLGAGIAIASTAAEDIESIDLLAGGLTGSGDLAVEVYAGAVPGAIGARTTTVGLPTAVEDAVGWVNLDGSHGSDLWESVAYLPDDWPVDRMLLVDGYDAGDHLAFRAGGLATFPAGRRIVNVQLALRAHRDSLRVGFRHAGVKYLRDTGPNGSSGEAGLFPAFRGTVSRFDYGEVCPWTGAPWTSDDIVELGDGTTDLYVGRTGASPWQHELNTLAVIVTHYADTRVAATVVPAASPQLHVPITWAKADATDYTIVTRPLAIAGGASRTGGIVALTSYTTQPVGAPHTRGLQVDADGIPSVTSNDTTSVPAVLLTVDGGGLSADSQPYGYLYDDDIAAAGDHFQLFEAPWSDDYGVIRAAVKVPPGGTSTRLHAEVRRNVDDELMGVPVEITREAALRGADLGNGYRFAVLQLGAPAPIVAGTEYRIEFSVVDGTDSWRVLALMTMDGGGTGAEGEAFGGGGGGAPPLTDEADYVALIAAVPLGTIDVDVVLLHAPLAPPVTPALGACHPATVLAPYARVSWAATDLFSFGRYEVERRDSRDPEWRLVAAIPDPTVTEFYDHEVRMGGTTTAYRVRQVRTDDIASPWAIVGPITVANPEGIAGGLILSTNQAPDLTVAAPEVFDSASPTSSFGFLDADDLTLRKVYGRDGLVAFRNPETRGVTFGRSLLVDAISGARRGVVKFDALRAIAGNRLLPYVCVRNGFGDRFLAAVNVTDADVTEPLDVHVAGVTVTELTDDPAPVVAANGSLGYPWLTLGSGRWVVDPSGVAMLREHVPGQTSLAVVDTGTPDHGFRAVLTGAGVPANASGIAVRVVDATTWIGLVRAASFGNWLYVVSIGGERTLVDSGIGAGSGTSLQLRAVGSGSTTIYAYDNGTLLGTYSVDSTVFDGETRAGLIYYGSAIEPPAEWDQAVAFDLDDDLGAPWEPAGGLWKIDEGGAYLAGTAYDGTDHNIVTTYAQSPDVQVRAVGSFDNFDVLVARYQDANNYLRVQFAPVFGAAALISRVAGVDTALAAWLADAGPAAQIVLQVDGPFVRVRRANSWQVFAADVHQTITLPDAAMAAYGNASHHGFGRLTRSAVHAGRFAAVQVDPVQNVGVSGAVIRGPEAMLGGRGSHVTAMRDLGYPIGQFRGDSDAARLRSTLAVADWGINDAILGTSPSSLLGFGQAVRSVASLWLANDIYQHVDAVYGPDWEEVEAIDRNTGVGYLQTVVDAQLAVNLVGDRAGSWVCLRFVGGGQFGGGTRTGVVSVRDPDRSIEYGTYDTNVWATTVAGSTIVTVRLWVPESSGIVELDVAADTTNGPVRFDGWHVEADDASAPTVAWCTLNRIPQSPQFHNANLFGPVTIGDTTAAWTPGIYAGTTVRIYSGTGAGQTRTIVANTDDTITVSAPWTTVPDATSDFIVPRPGSPWGAITDDDVAAYNAVLRSVVAEFTGAVHLVDIDSALNKRAVMFAGDGLHPSPAGAQVIAQAIATTIGRRGFRRLIVAGHSYTVGVGAGAGLGMDDRLRRLVIDPLVSDGFHRARRSWSWADDFTRG